MQLERVRISRGEPLIYSIDIFPRAFISGLLQEQDWSGSLFELFDERWQVQISSSRASIRAVPLPRALRTEIGVPAHTAWLYMEQLNVTKDGRPVSFHKIITEAKISTSTLSAVGIDRINGPAHVRPAWKLP